MSLPPSIHFHEDDFIVVYMGSDSSMLVRVFGHHQIADKNADEDRL